jgi:hypothetical protein
MGGSKLGVLGSSYAAKPGDRDDLPQPVGGNLPGPIGLGAGVQRIITRVIKDWEPPNPTNTPEIVVHGATIPDVYRSLNSANSTGEWGQAGGRLRTDTVPVGTSPNVTVTAHAGLLYRLPRWEGYDSAPAVRQAEWDRMFAKLKAHEDRHLEIAVEEADRLAVDLVGKEIGEIAEMVTAANARMRNRQIQLDAETDHGAKAGVPYGDVILNDVG